MSLEEETPDKPWIGQMVRDLALTGIAAVFMTEDSVRKYLKEMKLPKELGALILDNIAKRKDDFYGLLAKEFGQMISKVDLGTEFAKFLEDHRIHFEISFEPKHTEKKEDK